MSIIRNMDKLFNRKIENSHDIENPLDEISNQYINRNNPEVINTNNDGSDSDTAIDKVIIKTEGMTDKRKNQLKRITRMIQNCRASSLFFYSDAGYWGNVYWYTSIATILLSAINTLISSLMPIVSDDHTVQITNTILGVIITTGFSAIALMNAAVRQKDSENAGDRYNKISSDLYSETFFCNAPIDSLDLERIIEKYGIIISTCIDMYSDPPISEISKIMKSDAYNQLIKFKH